MHILYNQIVMNKIIIKEQLSQISKEINTHTKRSSYGSKLLMNHNLLYWLSEHKAHENINQCMELMGHISHFCPIKEI